MSPPRILVVDDDDAVARGFARVLGTMGYETRLAPNGSAAARMLGETQFDVMVIDLFMPERDGLETLRDAHNRRPEMGIVVASGGFAGGDVTPWLKVARVMGASSALKKPVSMVDLINAVQGAMVKPPRKVVSHVQPLGSSSAGSRE
jgi:CheY-like chemotaxis protein